MTQIKLIDRDGNLAGWQDIYDDDTEIECKILVGLATAVLWDLEIICDDPVIQARIDAELADIPEPSIDWQIWGF